MTDFWILLTAILAASACALVGSFLVLRKQAMLSDAISHAVLPGIVIAFLLTSSRNTFPMLIGAGAFGLLTVYLTDKLHSQGRIMHDSSMGIVFTTLFAIGVILISLFATSVDLDLDCVLYGEIAYVPWDTWTFRGLEMGPRPVWILGFVLLINLVFVITSFKELQIYSFDKELALSMGIPLGLIHYGLMGTVSFSTIAAFESVGAILVVALIIVPPATAYLLTTDLRKMIVLSVIIGILSAITGYLMAFGLNVSISGSMAVMTGVFFALAFLFSPLDGVISRKFRKTLTIEDKQTAAS
jgi:manganese/zinc/iron transport system permease protein